MALDNIYADVTSTSYVSAPFDVIGERYAPMLRALLPPGRAWNIEESSDFYSLLRALSYSFYRVYLRGQDLLREFDPTTMVELIDDWERVLGLPGDCPTPPTTIAGRRAAIHAKLLGNADPTASFFEDLAESAGYTAIIKHKEFYPFVAGSVAGAPLTNNASGGWKYFWRVIVAPGADDAMLQWIIESLVPLHTDVLVVFLGETWTEQVNPADSLLYGVAVDATTGRWVAVGNTDGVDSYIITSEGFENCPNAMRWDERAPTVAVAANLYGVAHDGSGLFVAVGEVFGGDAYIVTSPDGITWTERTNPGNTDLLSVAYGNGIWVAVGYPDATDAYIATSPDGITWTERANPKADTLFGVAYGGGLWVAVGSTDGGDAYIITATDPTGTWTERTNPKNFILRTVAYGNGLWVAAGYADGTDAYLLTATDPTGTWTERANPKNSRIYGVAYYDDFGIWVAVGASDGTDAYIITSSDGIAWTEQYNPRDLDLYGIAAYNGQLVAVGESDGTDGYIVTSETEFTSVALLNNDQAVPATTTIYVTVTAGNSATLYWGDGSSVALTADGTLHVYTHDYSAGTYTISVDGDIDGITDWRSYSQSFLSGDVAWFSALTSLTILSLSSTSVSGNISAMSSLTSLAYLYLGSTSVSGDISIMSGLTSLVDLHLYSTSVSGDVGDLNGLTSLVDLQLYSTSVSGDIGDLSGLTSLTILSLSSTSVSGNISAMSSLTSLAYLYLGSTSVSGDISIMSGLTSLVDLHLYSTSVSGDVGDLNGLTSLVDLHLYSTSLSYGSVALPPWAGADIQVQSVGLDSTEVDNFLIDLASGVGANGSLNIAGTNAARTSASDAAKTALLAAGWSVTVNE